MIAFPLLMLDVFNAWPQSALIFLINPEFVVWSVPLYFATGAGGDAEAPSRGVGEAS